MRGRSLHDLPFRSRWMRAPDQRLTADTGTRTAQNTVDGDAPVRHLAGSSSQARAKVAPPPVPSPESTSAHVADARAAEAFAAYDAGDSLRCIRCVEGCLDGMPWPSPTQAPCSLSPATSSVPPQVPQSPARANAAAGCGSPAVVATLPPLEETCALFHVGVRSYLALRRPQEAKRLCDAWGRYLHVHSTSVVEEGSQLHTHQSSLTAWRAVFLADAAEQHEHRREWEEASALLSEAEGMAGASRAHASLGAPQPREHDRLVLRRLMAQIKQAEAAIPIMRSRHHADVSVGQGGHQSVFAGRRRHHPHNDKQQQPNDVSGGKEEDASCKPKPTAIVASARSTLSNIMARLPSPRDSLEWVDVWVLARRCEAALRTLEAAYSNTPLVSRWQSQRDVLLSALEAIQQGWRILPPPCHSPSTRTRVSVSVHTDTALVSPDPPLVTRVLSGAATAEARHSEQAHRQRAERTHVFACRLLEEWCQLAVDCFALDLAIAATRNDGDVTRAVPCLCTRWRDVLNGPWVMAHVLPTRAAARPDGSSSQWSSRHLECALRAAHLLLTAAENEQRGLTWTPRQFALQGAAGALAALYPVRASETENFVDVSALRGWASALVTSVEEALPDAPCLIYRLHVSTSGRTTQPDPYEQQIRGSLACAKARLAEWEGRMDDALATYEQAFQTWVLSAFVSQQDATPLTHVPRSVATEQLKGRERLSRVAGPARTLAATNPPEANATATSQPSLLCLRCETFATLSPRSSLWRTLQTAIYRGSVSSLLLYMAAFTRCLVEARRDTLAVALLHTVEALLDSTKILAPGGGGSLTPAVSGAIVAVRLLRATTLCYCGRFTEAAAHCRDALCTLEKGQFAEAEAAMGDDDCLPGVVVAVQAPFSTVATARHHALHLWATVCAYEQRWTAAAELARRLLRHAAATTTATCAPSFLLLQSLLTLGWVLLDTDHAEEARRCAARVCRERRDAQPRVNAERKRAGLLQTGSSACVDAIQHEADYLHACAVRHHHHQ